MNILVSMNDAFVKYYQVMITSLCKNNPQTDITIHLPHMDALSDSGFAALKKTIKDNKAKLKEYYFTDSDLGEMNELPLGMWSVEMFFRLFAQDFIPKSEDRILWLDGDIIVNRDISSFYNTDFGENYYAACEDVAISRGKIQKEYDSLCWSSDEIYVNSGVLLINLAGLRKDKITKKEIVEFALDNKDKLCYPDQYILNAMFHKKIIVEDGFKYNCQVSGYSYTKGKQILKSSAILHFPGYRPWQTDYQKHYSSAVSGDIWWKYAKMCKQGQGYLKWKIINTVKVKPWQVVYRIGKAVKNK